MTRNSFIVTRHYSFILNLLSNWFQKIKAEVLTLLSSPISLGVFQIESYGPSVVRLLHVESKRYIVLTKEGTIETSVSRNSNAILRFMTFFKTFLQIRAPSKMAAKMYE